jgi:deoxyribodipyrimidine photo-lyase
MNTGRIRVLKEGQDRKGPVVYWMSRDQRVNDNWALLYAQTLAIERKAPLLVVFCLTKEFLNATERHYLFMLKGLQDVDSLLAKKNIGFHLLRGTPENELPRYIKKNRVAVLVSDFDPLKIKQKWKKAVLAKSNVALHEVDTHNIVPCWITSSKQEYGAYTIRPKIKHLLPYFLDTFPTVKQHPFSSKDRVKPIDWDKLLEKHRHKTSSHEPKWIQPGEKAAQKALRAFLKKKLKTYDTRRNNPTLDGQSNLSPYLHFGHLSAQRIALNVNESTHPHKIKEPFLEELIVRRELSDNFCFYNANYDSFDAFPEWAKKTLKAHIRDKRPYIYSLEQLELSQTHDPLWNAAQSEMVTRGKMHGYLRMYWGKKILEWTPSPEEALQYAVYLNDKYELDGRDPNGYTGIAWSIGGLHDRAWGERPIFGKIRYMSYNGCKTKFKINEYIKKIELNASTL